jgi:hypothetical protein
VLQILVEVNICILSLSFNNRTYSNLVDVSFYPDNNQLKRSLSGSDQRGSPFKKRQFTQQKPRYIQTGLLIYLMNINKIFSKIDEDDDDDDDDEGGNISPKTTNGIKRDDSRRRAAHTAAEQKRRNSIRVNKMT